MPQYRVDFKMKIKIPEITTEEILEHWRQGKSTLDWRPLTTRGKRVSDMLQDNFEFIISSFRDKGIAVELD